MNKIKTSYDPKPIPLRSFDWCAIRDNYEPPMPQGFGSTEKAAIQDLLVQELEDAGGVAFFMEQEP